MTGAFMRIVLPTGLVLDAGTSLYAVIVSLVLLLLIYALYAGKIRLTIFEALVLLLIVGAVIWVTSFLFFGR